MSEPVWCLETWTRGGEACTFELLFEFLVTQVRWHVVMLRVLLDAHVQERGLEPIDGHRYIGNGTQRNLRIQMLDDVVMLGDDPRANTAQPQSSASLPPPAAVVCRVPEWIRCCAGQSSWPGIAPRPPSCSSRGNWFECCPCRPRCCGWLRFGHVPGHDHADTMVVELRPARTSGHLQQRQVAQVLDALASHILRRGLDHDQMRGQVDAYATVERTMKG